MSANDARHPPLEADVAAILDDLLAPLFADDDVSAIELDEGRGATVTRRARRERIAIDTPRALFDALSAHGAFSGAPLARSLAGGDVLKAAMMGDTRRIHVARAPTKPVLMISLFEEGLVDDESATRLMGAIQSGRHVVVSGPCASGRRRLAIALVTESEPYLSVARLDARGPSALVEAPPGASLIERARRAAELGVELLLVVDVPATDLGALIDDDPPLVVVASVAAPRVALVDTRVEHAVVGFSATGAAKVEHAPSRVVISPIVDDVTPPRARPVSASHSVATTSLEALPALAPGPPTGWGTRHDDTEPGWELMSASEPSAFDDVMRAVREKKTYTPHPPPLHPAATRLRGLGGLTLEPPAGDEGPPDDEEEPR